ncbi:MAG: hypothetical protein U0Q16_25650 [Bryobacteraceae bacterium]
MRNTSKYVFAAIASASWLLHGPLASAGVIGTYNDRATWQGLTTGATNIDFESLGLSPGGYHDYSSGLTTGGVQFTGFTGSSSFLFAINPPTNAAEEFGSLTELRGPDFLSGSYISALLPSNVTSFGLDLMTAYPNGAGIRIQLNGIDLGIVVSTQARPTRTFFGVRTDTPISELRFILDGTPNNNTFALIDNISYGLATTSGGGGGGTGGDSPSETPEATTMLYVATGTGVIAWARKRKKLAFV